ncbi:hypothetical protein [Streptomyces sp. CL12]|uniref:hypothetical protein n=1 Tax=Streptomyces sp. CL12 TaxID=3391744 RepID=UPI003A80DD23
MVIEYKKGSDSGVLSQAVSYLSWLDSAHRQFGALVRKTIGTEAAEAVDRRRPRMVCIAAGFSHHDRVAVQRLPERIDLVRYRVFEGGLLSLLLWAPPPARVRNRLSPAGRWRVDLYRHATVPEATQALLERGQKVNRQPSGSLRRWFTTACGR